MALARTDVGVWVSGASHGTGSFSTGSFTPPANSLLIVRVVWMGNNLGGDLGVPTVSGGGLTWTRDAALDNRFDGAPPADWNCKGVTFTASVGASPSAMTITVADDTSQDIHGWVVSVVAVTGHDLTTPLVSQVTSGHNTNISDGAHALTLPAAPGTDDVTLCWLDVDAEGTAANPTLDVGWTEIHDAGVAGGGSLIATLRREDSVSTTVSIADVYTGMGSFFKAGMTAVVVKAAAAGGRPPIGYALGEGQLGVDKIGAHGPEYRVRLGADPEGQIYYEGTDEAHARFFAMRLSANGQQASAHGYGALHASYQNGMEI